jgi:hypothetical protein
VETKSSWGRPAQRAQQRLHVLPQGRRIRHIDHRVERLAAEEAGSAAVILAIAGDAPRARGQALLMAAPVEDGHGVAALLERLHEVQADELRPAEHENPHDAGF